MRCVRRTSDPRCGAAANAQIHRGIQGRVVETTCLYRHRHGDILVVFYAGYAHVSLSTADFPLAGRLCMVRSSDEGRTWTAPAILYDDEDDNRDPHVAQLDDGTIVCTFFSVAEKNHNRLRTSKDPKNDEMEKNFSGVQIILSHRLPMTSIHISDDDAQTWPGPHSIDSCIGAYPAAVELKDQSILIVYYTEGGGSAIRARRFQIKPSGIEFLPL